LTEYISVFLISKKTMVNVSNITWILFHALSSGHTGIHIQRKLFRKNTACKDS